MASLLLAAGDFLHAASFTAPADGPVPFRRDRIPLEANVMKHLSQQLVALAKSLDGSKPEVRRGQAQMLALSMALSPGNPEARDALENFQSKSPRREPFENTERVTQRLRELVAWLENEEAGKDAAALGVCLRDVMRHFDPMHPYYDDPWDQGEFGKWAAWVPGIEAYQSQVVKVAKPRPVPDGEGLPKPVETKPAETKPGKFVLSLPEVEIMTPMWRMVGQKPSQGWTFKTSPLKATAHHPSGDEWDGFSLRIGEPGGPVDFHPLQSRLEQILKDHHRQLPNRLRVAVRGAEFAESLSSQKDQSISAIPAVLSSAVITGRKPVAMVIGTVGWDKKIGSGTYFWGKLKSLEKGRGQRLVISPDCEPYIQAKLTMHPLDFFLEYEVMYAATYEQLLDRALEGGSESVASASQKFKLIQEVSKGQNILRYVANIHVKKRLAEVVELDPGHVSARLLLQQANNGRSNSIPRPMAAAEIAWILEPLYQLADMPNYVILESAQSLPDLGAMEKSARDQLDDLQIYLNRDEREWGSRAVKAVSKIRDLERALGNRDEYARSNEVYRALETLNDELRDLRRELDDAGGQAGK